MKKLNMKNNDKEMIFPSRPGLEPGTYNARILHIIPTKRRGGLFALQFYFSVSRSVDNEKVVLGRIVTESISMPLTPKSRLNSWLLAMGIAVRMNQVMNLGTLIGREVSILIQSKPKYSVNIIGEKMNKPFVKEKAWLWFKLVFWLGICIYIGFRLGITIHYGSR